MNTIIHYRDTEGIEHDLVLMGQGHAVPANAEDLEKDAHGFTNPNLHRRVDPHQPPPESGEVAPREYELAIGNLDSYKTVKLVTHDEESTTCEIP